MKVSVKELIARINVIGLQAKFESMAKLAKKAVILEAVAKMTLNKKTMFPCADTN